MNLIEEEKEKSIEYQLAEEKLPNGKKIVKINKDNVYKVTAMIYNNSNYNASVDKELGIIYKKNSKEVKYRGSSAYWFEKLKSIIDTTKNTTEDGFTYECIIENIIIAIDNENSTHLNSDKVGRNSTKEKILEIHRKDLINLLKNPGKEYELVDIIRKKRMENEKDHLSFASKFCHYACINLFKKTKFADNFSIYDNVMKKALPYYAEKYLGNSISMKEYENKYSEYIKLIDNIRKSAKEAKEKEISRNGFDHLIWYYHKGRK